MQAVAVTTFVSPKRLLAASSDPYGYGQMFVAGYPDPLTVTNSDELRIWVQSGKNYSFRIARLNLHIPGLRRENPVFEGPRAITPSSEARRGLWGSYAVFPTTGWPDGLYAIDIGPDNILPSINTTFAAAVFIVRRAATSRILYKLPTNTWNAYGRMPWKRYDQLVGSEGDVKNRSFYENRASSLASVPYYRPGIGMNGGQISGWVISPSVAGSNTLLEGHEIFLPWLVSAFGEIDFCTDLDLHAPTSGQMLDNCRLLICAGHDEYWSPEMRSSVAAHVNKGRNIAFLGGNNLYWKATITSSISTDPLSILYDISVDKTPSERLYGGWGSAENEARLTGLSGRGGGGWQPTYLLHKYTFHPTVEYAWVRHGMSSMSFPTTNSALIAYEFDETHASTPSDYVAAATTGPVITATSGLDWKAHSDLSATVCYFQPFGGVVNVGTTEWIRHVVNDPASVGRMTKNVIQTMSADRRFLSVGQFSRPLGFDILYSNQINLDGETNSSSVVGFWALDATQASATIERGKWVSRRQTVSGYVAKAFGRNSNGSSRLYYQGADGQLAVWHIQMTTTEAKTLRPLVGNGAYISPSASNLNLVGAGLISGSTELDLIFTSAENIVVWTMTGSLGKTRSSSVTMSMPVAGVGFRAFGSLPLGGIHVPAVALMDVSNRLILAKISMSGLVVVADTTVNGLLPESQIVGFADLNNDGYAELIISHDNFTAGVSSAVMSSVPLNVTASALTELSMKAGFLHDS